MIQSSPNVVYPLRFINLFLHKTGYFSKFLKTAILNGDLKDMKGMQAYKAVVGSCKSVAGKCKSRVLVGYILDDLKSLHSFTNYSHVHSFANYSHVHGLANYSNADAFADYSNADAFADYYHAQDLANNSHSKDFANNSHSKDFADYSHADSLGGLHTDHEMNTKTTNTKTSYKNPYTESQIHQLWELNLDILGAFSITNSSDY